MQAFPDLKVLPNEQYMIPIAEEGNMAEKHMSSKTSFYFEKHVMCRAGNAYPLETFLCLDFFFFCFSQISVAEVLSKP